MVAREILMRTSGLQLVQAEPPRHILHRNIPASSRDLRHSPRDSYSIRLNPLLIRLKSVLWILRRTFFHRMYVLKAVLGLLLVLCIRDGNCQWIY